MLYNSKSYSRILFLDFLDVGVGREQGFYVSEGLACVVVVVMFFRVCFAWALFKVQTIVLQCPSAWALSHSFSRSTTDRSDARIWNVQLCHYGVYQMSTADGEHRSAVLRNCATLLFILLLFQVKIITNINKCEFPPPRKYGSKTKPRAVGCWADRSFV